MPFKPLKIPPASIPTSNHTTLTSFPLLQNPHRRLVQQVERLLHERLQLRQGAQVGLERLQRGERLTLDLLVGVELVDGGEALELGGEVGKVLPGQAGHQLGAALLLHLALVVDLDVAYLSRLVQVDLEVEHVGGDEELHAARAHHELQTGRKGQTKKSDKKMISR